MLSKKTGLSGGESKIERITSRILVPFVLFVLFTLFGAMAGVYWLQQRSIEAHSAELQQHVWVSYAENLKEAASLLGSPADFQQGQQGRQGIPLLFLHPRQNQLSARA